MRRGTWRRVQRGGGLALAACVVLLLADSAFLAWSDMPGALVTPLTRAHLWLGGAMCVLLPAFVLSHVGLHKAHRNRAARRIGIVVATVAGLGTLAGVSLWAVGKSSAVRWLVLLHEGAFALAIASYVLHRLRARVTPALRGEQVAAASAVVLGAGIWAAV